MVAVVWDTKLELSAVVLVLDLERDINTPEKYKIYIYITNWMHKTTYVENNLKVNFITDCSVKLYLQFYVKFKLPSTHISTSRM